jgi:aminopeptidase N
VILPLLLALQDPLAVRPDTLHPVHDALNYNITIVIPDTGSQIRGEAEITWRLGSAAPVRMQLDTALHVTRAAWSGERRLLRGEWNRVGELIELPHHGHPGDTVTTRVEYAGVVRDGLIIGNNTYGDRVAFADNWPDRAHHWFPAQDHPSDKATVTLRIEAPRGWRAIGNGKLERSGNLPGGRAQWRYRVEQPIPVYTMVVGAGPLSVVELPDAACAVRCVPLSVWSYRQDSAYAVNGPFRRAGDMVLYFSRLVGPYPFSSLAHVESRTRYGGMENVSAIFYNEKDYQKQRLSEGVVAHETAHQWFGDAVTEGDWHHLWLSEGFATYFSALWEGHAAGDSAFQRVMHAAATSVFDVTDSSGTHPNPVTERPIIDPAATDLMGLLSSNNYPKGAWVLHQLRGVIGDSAFFRGVRAYYADYRNRNALSSDFAAEMSKSAGTDLGWYFRQALTQAGYPVVDVRWTWADRRLSLVVRQTQKAGWGEYRLPGLEVRVDGKIYPIDIAGRETRIDLPDVARPPSTVEIDPRGRWLLRSTVASAM